ncbi:MAG: SpoIIE family protein phosphatase [Pseudomonadales bacterium]|nr:SpoIIE family protein phosphatase [Pseudomonadales bacterium]
MTEETAEPQSKIPLYRSVSGKLALLLLSVTAVTAIVLTSVDYWYIRETVEQDFRRELQAHVKALGEFVQEYRDGKRETARKVASSGRVARALASSPSEQALLDLREMLVEQVRASRDLTGASVWSLDGRLIASEPLDQAGSRSWQERVSGLSAFSLGNGGKESESDVALRLGDTTAPSSIAVAAVHSLEGEVLGTAVLEFDAMRFASRLTGMLTGHQSNQIRLAVRDADGAARYAYASRDTDRLGRWDPTTDRPVALALEGQSGVLQRFVDFRGINTTVAFASVEGGDLAIASQVDVVESLQRISASFMALLLAALAWLVVTALLAVSVARRYLRPVRRLSSATRHLALGQLDHRVPVTTRDEVGELGQAFNEMAGTMGKHNEELESRVQARTKQLESSRKQLERLVRALENQAELMERDLRRAEVIQRSLLPVRPPKISGWRMSALYIPGRNVGGDIYDVVEIDENQAALIVADAAGHGVSAAMLSALFKHRLDEVCGRIPIENTQDVVKSLNRSLIEDVSAPGVFVTAVFCVLNHATGSLSVVSAGHSPLVLLRAGGEILSVEKGGPALGLYSDAEFCATELALDRGDRLLAYTDGLFSVSRESPSDPEEIARAMMGEAGGSRVLERVLARASQGEQYADRDDVTMLLLEAEEGEHHFEHRDSVTARTDSPAENGANGYAPLRYAESSDGTFLFLDGRMTWVHGQVLFDAATSVIEEGRRLIIDLSTCSYVDSAMLGALHEVAERATEIGASISIQNASPAVLQSITELGMESVLDLMLSAPHPVPETKTEVEAETVDYRSHQLRLLKAHEVLADLNEHNRGEFSGVVDDLRGEVIETSKPSRKNVSERI